MVEPRYRRAQLTMVTIPRIARVPRHLGLIPDGNRRWADTRSLARHEGYAAGIEPGLQLVDACRSLGIAEVSVYGFTKENVRRPAAQVRAFRGACIRFAERVTDLGAALLVVGDMRSKAFPDELRRYAVRSSGDIRINLLANYSWRWDLHGDPNSATHNGHSRSRDITHRLASGSVPRVDLVVRWGGRQRLSGFLPIQSSYADFYMIDSLWPDMKLEDFFKALRWYGHQEDTLGG